MLHRRGVSHANWQAERVSKYWCSLKHPHLNCCASQNWYERHSNCGYACDTSAGITSWFEVPFPLRAAVRILRAMSRSQYSCNVAQGGWNTNVKPWSITAHLISSGALFCKQYYDDLQRCMNFWCMLWKSFKNIFMSWKYSITAKIILLFKPNSC